MTPQRSWDGEGGWALGPLRPLRGSRAPSCDFASQSSSLRSSGDLTASPQVHLALRQPDACRRGRMARDHEHRAVAAIASRPLPLRLSFVVCRPSSNVHEVTGLFQWVSPQRTQRSQRNGKPAPTDTQQSFPKAVAFGIILTVRNGNVTGLIAPDENRRGEAGRIGHRLQTGLK